MNRDREKLLGAVLRSREYEAFTEEVWGNLAGVIQRRKAVRARRSGLWVLAACLTALAAGLTLTRNESEDRSAEAPLENASAKGIPVVTTQKFPEPQKVRTRAGTTVYVKEWPIKAVAVKVDPLEVEVVRTRFGSAMVISDEQLLACFEKEGPLLLTREGRKELLFLNRLVE